MCGIAGFWSRAAGADELRHRLARMTGCIAYRGPDADGHWSDPSVGIGLGHRRLAIVDLSPEGQQPMTSATGRYVIVFNGEIYNFRALRAELEALGHTAWRGHSDTEVMLAAFEQWGVVQATTRFAGMFAFALWDTHARVLHLVRDRLGIKPLYYGWSGGTLLFGSELKALRRYPGFAQPLDLEAVGTFLRHDFIPGPRSIHEGIVKLTPGAILTVRGPDDRPEPVAYWSPLEAARAGHEQPFRGSPEEAADALHDLLRLVVGEHMVADVPLGAFLSGGIDSSLVVALMQAQSARPVRTFAIGFGEARFNEAEHAKAVSRQLGTAHTEMYVTPEEMLGVIPRLPAMYDEPFADSSQVPTALVSALARRHVTVSLSGDGGDELFAGYTRYGWTAGVWNRLQRIPRGLRSGPAALLQALPEGALDAALAPVRMLLPRHLRQHAYGARLHRLAEYAAVPDRGALYARVMSHTDPRRALVQGGRGRFVAERPVWAAMPEFLHGMMLWDLTTYLPDDILVKVDRASMAVSLEARVPLLDHRVAEFAWTLPTAYKTRDGRGKLPLRAVLSRYVPPALFERPKTGFSIPIADWLRGPLREWAGDLLSPERLRRSGLLDPRFVARRLEDHLRGRADNAWALWNMLMLEAWLDAQRADDGSPLAGHPAQPLPRTA